MSRSPQALALLGAALAVAACGVLPVPPPALETDFIPDVAAATVDASSITTDGFTTEQHLAVRIRVETCTGWATGSGWVLSDHEVVTNRHVIEGAIRIEITTYDGRDFTVLSSQVAGVADLGLLTLDSVFAETADYEVTQLSRLDPVSIVGYPEGQALTVEEGHFLESEEDDVNDSGELVWLLRAHVEPGNSGSPVYNDEGSVVAVLYAGDEYHEALAWPVAWLDALIQDPSGWQDNTTTCE